MTKCQSKASKKKCASSLTQIKDIRSLFETILLHLAITKRALCYDRRLFKISSQSECFWCGFKWLRLCFVISHEMDKILCFGLADNLSVFLDAGIGSKWNIQKW